MDLEANRLVAERLREYATLLQAQAANPFRVAAYRKAADTVQRCAQPLGALFASGGREALQQLPGVGPGIAGAIVELLLNGQWSQLERLRGSIDPEVVLQTVPGIGPELAHTIHEALHIDTLEALEAAAFDGRLESLPGIGPRRSQGIRAALDTLLQRRPLVKRGALPLSVQPTVATLLDVDREYRERAAAGTLPTIAPRRFNPDRTAWLPVLHTDREPWHFTALFSNTAQAHRFGRTRDWVVVYFYDHEHREGQHTVVTVTRGALGGRRIVRGREDECMQLYGQTDADPRAS